MAESGQTTKRVIIGDVEPMPLRSDQYSTFSAHTTAHSMHDGHHHEPLPGEVHHTPDEPATGDPEREYLHDGTTYAVGASQDSYDAATPNPKPTFAQRVKEAIPGTKEHKAKVDAEGKLAVYM